jgi:hypothetical protein
MKPEVLGTVLQQIVIPAQAGIQLCSNLSKSWIPACAGMTSKKAFGSQCTAHG